MEHLFKLKNDEKKTVGYLLLKCGAIFWKTRYVCDEWTCNQEFAFEWSTAHPFVIKDKNNKEVYAGDKTNKGIAIASLKDWVLTYTKDDSTYHWHINIKADIELIEDKDNEAMD